MAIMELLDKWLRERRCAEWCTVAQQCITEHDEGKLDLFTTSVLASGGSVESVLKRWEYIANPQFGQSAIGRDVKDNSLMMYEETSKHIGQKNEVVIEPFAFVRQWADTWPTRFELVQNFILFYNLHRDKDCYKAVSSSGEVTDVVKVSCKPNEKYLKIRTNFLRNYLAFKDRILVRQFDNRASQDDRSPPCFESDYCKETLKGNDFVFLKMTYNNNSGGVLFGKDAIFPITKRKDLLGWPAEQCSFIIGIDEEGEHILASYSKDDGPTKFLIPVYFKREVLQKYYNSPTAYEVTDTMVSHFAHWGIPIDVNRAELVQVYLGDIAERLPYNEQLHWRSYNVLPEGGITRKRYRRDFEARFVESDDPIYQFKKSRESFQEQFESRFNFKPFKPLSDADKFKEDSLRIPLNNEPNEFENQIVRLAILLPELIDQTSIKARLTGTPENGSINALEMFLKEQEASTTIIAPLRKIQNLRSKSVHAKKSDYENVVKKYGIDESNRPEFFRRLLQEMTSAFNEFAA